MVHIPSFFLARIRLRESPGASRSERVSELTAVKPTVIHQTDAHTVELLFSEDGRHARNTRLNVSLVLHGEIYEESVSDVPNDLLSRYLERGEQFVAGLNGSFAILIVDGTRDRISVFTDRLNTRTVFCMQRGGEYWVATALAFHMLPLEDLELDPAGLGHYLVNGIPLNDRTIFDGVRSFGRGTVNTLTKKGFDSRRYWHYRFTKDNSDVASSKLRGTLADLLISSVRNRMSNKDSIFLSLSGGYDSPSIVAAFKHLGVENVTCFSYGDDAPTAGTDAYVAQKTAASLGYRHLYLSAFNLDLSDVLWDNVLRGQANTRLIIEPEVWRRLESRFRSREAPVLYVGEECLGWLDVPLKTIPDVLESVDINDFKPLSWIEPFIPRDKFRVLFEGVGDDLEVLLERASHCENLHDMKDFLYLDQRLSRMLRAREFFVGPMAKVCNPLLDSRILDFTARLPTSARRGKALFKEAVTERFPAVFRHARATEATPRINTWARRTLDSQVWELEEELRRPCVLDEYIPGEFILELWEQHRSSAELVAQVRRGVRAAKSQLAHTAPGQWLAGRLRSKEQRRAVPKATFLARVFLLRLYLQSRVGSI